jgi:hypothetical protein
VWGDGLLRAMPLVVELPHTCQAQDEVVLDLVIDEPRQDVDDIAAVVGQAALGSPAYPCSGQYV